MGVNSVGGSSIPSSALLGPVSVNVDPSFLNDPVAQEVVTALENLSKSAYAPPAGQSTTNFVKTGDINIHIDGSRVSLTNPVYTANGAHIKIANPAEFMRKVGQFLSSGTRTVGDTSVNVPGLNQRLGVINTANNGILANVSSDAASTAGDTTATTASDPGGLNSLPSFGPPTTTGDSNAAPPSSAGDLYGGMGAASEVSMTPDESAAYAKMTPAEQSQYMLQKKMEAHARMVALMTNLMKMMHDTLMGVIQNIKS